MNLTGFFKGSGGRRRSDESWIALTDQLSEAQRLLAPLKDAIRNTCAAGIHGPFWVQQKAPVPCPWCHINRLQNREVAQVVIAPALPAGRPMVPAAVDVLGFEPLPEAPLKSADDQLLLMPDAPEFPAEVEAADVNAETQAVAVSSLWAAIGEDRTAMLPAVDDPSAAVHLQPAADTVPPKPRQPPLPPAHLVEQQLVTWKPKLPGDPLASDDLKTVAPATGVPGTGGWQSVQLTR